MNFNLTAPCGNCPFRSDGAGITLRRERAREILDCITTQQLTFSCHKTVRWDQDDLEERIAARDEEHCAGALILLEHIERPNQMMRIAERLGQYHRDGLHMDSPVFETGRAFIAHHGERR